SGLLVGFVVGVEPKSIKEIERDDVDAADGSGHEVFAHLIDASREELERVAERARSGVSGVGFREPERDTSRDLLELVGTRELPPEQIEVERREDRGESAA